MGGVRWWDSEGSISNLVVKNKQTCVTYDHAYFQGLGFPKVFSLRLCLSLPPPVSPGKLPVFVSVAVFSVKVTPGVRVCVFDCVCLYFWAKKEKTDLVSKSSGPAGSVKASPHLLHLLLLLLLPLSLPQMFIC